MDKTLKKAEVYSIIAGILFLLSFFHMTIITKSTYSTMTQAVEKSKYSNYDINNEVEFGEYVIKYFDNHDDFRNYYAEYASELLICFFVFLVTSVGFYCML